MPDETETGSKVLFVVYGSCATSLTHYLSLSHIIILYFMPYICYGCSPSSPLPALHPSFFPFIPPHCPFMLPLGPPAPPVCASPLFLPPPSSSPPLLPSRLFFFFPPSFSLSLSLSSGLSKDGGGSANAESLEEVLNILAEEGSDWIYGFFTFLYDVVSSPVERGKEEEDEGKEAAAAEMQEEGGAASSDDGEVNGVILDPQN